MHMDIMIFVSADCKQDAIDAAHHVAENVVDYYPSFDYFSEDSFCEKDPDKDVIVCVPANSPAGKKLIEEHIAFQKADFMAHLKKIKELLAKYDDQKLFEDDPDLFRNRCWVLGSSGSPYTYFYDRYGNGLTTPDAVKTALEDTDTDNEQVWIKPVSVHC
jgi:hypothetical protein